MTDTVQSILALEWILFQQVQNIGGRAGCQDDRETFFLMRSSQLRAWNHVMRSSYLQDLREARTLGRNPLSEKYGYMMEHTDPVNFAAIRDSLPPISPEKQTLIDAIAAAHRDWAAETSVRYPRLTGRGRPTDSRADNPGTTSFETYLCGELATYSLRTLEHYLAYVRQLQTQGQNLHEMILHNTVVRYGYSGLDQAERALSRP